MSLPQASARPLAGETGRVFQNVPWSVTKDLVGLLFFLLPLEWDTADDDAATAPAGLATPCRLSTELSSTSTDAAAFPLAAASSPTSVPSTATLARLRDRPRDGVGEGGSTGGGGEPAAASGGDASSDEARRLAAELRLVSTIAAAGGAGYRIGNAKRDDRAPRWGGEGRGGEVRDVEEGLGFSVASV